jgi:hypothetical protein
MIRGQKLIYATFIALLISAFVCAQSTTVVAAAKPSDRATEVAD